MNEENSYLGRGWSFPPQFNIESRTVHMAADETDIEQSLHILLSTRLRERLMQPEYGCSLETMLFEPVTVSLKTLIKDRVFTAIYYHEPRVEPLDVLLVASEEEGLVNIFVEYRLRSTNTRHNIVFPFYINEGTNIS